MAQIDIQSSAISLFSKGIGNSHLNNFPFLKVLDEAGSIQYKPLCDGVKNTVTALEKPVVFTDANGSGMVEHNLGLMYSVAYHKTLPVKRTINKDQIDLANSSATQVNPVEAVFGNTTETMFNSLSAACFSDGSNPLEIEGILAAAAAAPDKGSYQGISGEKNAFWRNASFDAKVVLPDTPFDGKPTTPKNVVQRLNYVMANNMHLGSAQFRYVLLGQAYYNMVLDAMVEKTIITANTDENVRVGYLVPKLNNVIILNAGGFNVGGYKGFPSKYALFFDPSNFILFYDNPFKRGNALQSLINLKNVPSEFKVKSAEDVKSMFYVDALMNNAGVGAFKSEDSLSQWSHILWRGNLMCRDRRRLSLMHEV